MTIRETYIQYRTDPDNDERSLAYFATKNGFSLNSVREALSDAKQVEREILEARRDKYSKRMQKIDDALFKSAEQGDTRAADLLYRRFDGWNPKIVEENNHFYNFAEIAKSVAKKVEATRSLTVKRDMPDGGKA